MAAADGKTLRWYIASVTLNTFFCLWSFGGSVFVLFLDELGLPKGRIGTMLSLFPFCGLLALGFAPVAARWGRKRVFLAGYGLRKIVMAGLLLLPWILARAGAGAGLAWLFGVISVFAVLRALAETAFYPWAQEFIPGAVRGRWTGWSSVVTVAASALALAIAGVVLEKGTGLTRFMGLIGAGCVLGLAGVFAMAPLPGGAPVRPAGDRQGAAGLLRAALRDRNFTAYLAGTAGLALGTGMLLGFLPLFVHERLGVPKAGVVRLDILLMAGGGLASLAAGWLSDRLGSRPVLMPSAFGLGLTALAWLVLPASWLAAGGAAVLYTLYGVTSSGVAIGAGRLLYNGVTPPEHSTAYMALYYAGMGLAGGLGPLVAGALLTAFPARSSGGPDGFRLLFAVAFLFLAAGWAAYGRVRPDGRHTTRGLLRDFLARATFR